MKNKIASLLLKIVLKWLGIYKASDMLKDAYYGEGFCEAIRLAHRNLHQSKSVTFSKEFERFESVSPELLEVKLFAKRKKIEIEYV